MNNILGKIIAQKRVEVANLNLADLRFAAEKSPTPRDFNLAIRTSNHSKKCSLIAELKRASPSKGILAPHLDLIQVADVYMENGAAAISVLTDEKFFGGSLQTLHELRFSRQSKVPLLRKDFVIDQAQIYEARVYGADAILLILAAIQDDSMLSYLHACAQNIGLSVLVEVHDENEIERALHLEGIQTIGINNRNLSNFDVSLETTKRLRPLIPTGITVVAESGIFNSADVTLLAESNIDAILVGEALVTSPNIAAKVRELSGI